MFFAHRGAVMGKPWLKENSLEALRHAMQGPWDGIEFDVRLTADKVVVIHHDETFSDGRILSECSYKDVIELPRLEQLLLLRNELNYDGVMIIDIKTYRTIELVTAILQAFHVEPGHVILASFLHPEIERISEERYWVCAWTTECFPCNLEDQLARGRLLLLCCSSIDWENEVFLRKLKTSSEQIVLWTVNSPMLAKKCIDMGVSVISDCVDIFISSEESPSNHFVENDGSPNRNSRLTQTF